MSSCPTPPAGTGHAPQAGSRACFYNDTWDGDFYITPPSGNRGDWYCFHRWQRTCLQVHTGAGAGHGRRGGRQTGTATPKGSRGGLVGRLPRRRHGIQPRIGRRMATPSFLRTAGNESYEEPDISVRALIFSRFPLSRECLLRNIPGESWLGPSLALGSNFFSSGSHFRCEEAHAGLCVLEGHAAVAEGGDEGVCARVPIDVHHLLVTLLRSARNLQVDEKVDDVAVAVGVDLVGEVTVVLVALAWSSGGRCGTRSVSSPIPSNRQRTCGTFRRRALRRCRSKRR